MALPFYQNDPLAEADPLSRAVVNLELISPDFGKSDSTRIIATGSGIVWQNPNTSKLYLITAWHNLSGKEPDTLQPKHSKKCLPYWVRIRGFYFEHTEQLRQGKGEPDSDPPTYWLHPDGNKHDIAILPLSRVQKCNCVFRILYSSAAAQVFVSEPVFVIGYPLGLVNNASPNHPYPIWKIGNIANDPGPSFNGLPRFMIDATTLPGMSGSPVIRRYNYGGKPGHSFLGIYVGRYVVPTNNQVNAEAFGNEPTQVSSALGWVVKPSVIYETLEHAKPPNDPFL